LEASVWQVEQDEQDERQVQDWKEEKLGNWHTLFKLAMVKKVGSNVWRHS
jgi:hypothetical protein